MTGHGSPLTASSLRLWRNAFEVAFERATVDVIRSSDPFAARRLRGGRRRTPERHWERDEEDPTAAAVGCHLLRPGRLRRK